MNRRNCNKIEEIYKKLTEAADSGTHTYLDDNGLKKLLNPIQKSLMSHSDPYAFCLPEKCEIAPFDDTNDDILLIKSVFTFVSNMTIYIKCGN